MDTSNSPLWHSKLVLFLLIFMSMSVLGLGAFVFKTYNSDELEGKSSVIEESSLLPVPTVGDDDGGRKEESADYESLPLSYSPSVLESQYVLNSVGWQRMTGTIDGITKEGSVYLVRFRNGVSANIRLSETAKIGEILVKEQTFQGEVHFDYEIRPFADVASQLRIGNRVLCTYQIDDDPADGLLVTEFMALD